MGPPLTVLPGVAAALVAVLVGIGTEGLPKLVLFAIYLTGILWVSLQNFRFGVSVLVALLPQQGVIRWDDWESSSPAGVVTLLTIGLVATLAIRKVIKRKPVSFMRQEIPLLGLMAIFLSLVIAQIIASSSLSPVLILLMAREYVVPLLTFVLVYAVLKEDTRLGPYILLVLFISTVFVAVLNLVHYIFGLGIDLPRWVVHYSSGIPAVRTFGPLELPRLNHILGLSTQGAGAVYYVIVGAVGLTLSNAFSWSWGRRVMLVAGSLVLFSAALLSLSLSAIFAAALIVFAWLVMTLRSPSRACQNTGIILLVPAVAFMMVVFYWVSLSGLTIYEYGYQSFIKPVGEWLARMTLYDFVFGSGLGLKGATWLENNALDVPGAVIFDRWVLVAFLQMGMIGFLSMMSVWVAALLTAVFQPTERGNPVLWACAAIFVGMFAFAHGAAPLERLFSPLFGMGLALLLTSMEYTKRPIIH